MKRRIISFLLIVAMLLPASIIVNAEESSIVVLYTNDVHCAIDDYAVLAAYRAELISQGNAVVTVDVGDAIQGEIIGTQTNGLAVVDIMNTVGYDYAVPGNHEFDYGMENFLDIANNKATYKYISSNFYYLPTVTAVLEPYSIKDINGKKIAFVGISTPETVTKSTPSYFKDENNNFIYGFPTWDMKEGVLYENIQESVDLALEEGADMVIALGHSGIAETTDGWKSTDVIANTSGIDVFLDAHSHETFVSDVYKNKNGEDVILSSTGTKFANFGALTINSNGETSFELINPDNVDIDTMSADGKEAYNTLKMVVDGYNQEIEDLYGKIGSSEAELVSSDDNGWLVRKQETNMGDFVTDAYRAVTGADVAITNGGGVRSNIAVGDVSKKLLMDVNPWSNAMCVLEITGEQLLNVLEHGARACPEPLGGFFQISGASYEIHADNESPVITDQSGNYIDIDTTKPRRVQNVIVNGEPIDLEKKYTIAGSQYVLTEGGDGLTMLDGATVVAKDGLLCDSEMLIKYFTETLGGVITSEQYGNPNGDGRITIIGNDLNKTDYEIKVGETIVINAFELESEKITHVTFIPEESGLYRFESLACNSIDPYCELYEEGGDGAIWRDDDTIVRDFSLEYYFEAGKAYYFTVQLYNATSAEIEVALDCAHSFEDGICTVCNEECDHSSKHAAFCDCGSFYTGNELVVGVDATYDSVSTDGKWEWYRFIPEETSVYTLCASNSTGDPMVYLYDKYGNELTVASGTNLNLKYMFIEGQDYYFCVTDFYIAGKYNFSITSLGYLLGDVNDDGWVDNMDAAIILKYDAGIIDLTDELLEMGDINADGLVDNMDAAMILKYDAGIIDWEDIL